MGDSIQLKETMEPPIHKKKTSKEKHKKKRSKEKEKHRKRKLKEQGSGTQKRPKEIHSDIEKEECKGNLLITNQSNEMHSPNTFQTEEEAPNMLQTPAKSIPSVSKGIPLNIPTTPRLSYQDAIRLQIEMNSQRKRASSLKVFKEEPQEMELHQVQSITPFVKVQKVNLDDDSRVISSKWRPSKVETEERKASFNTGVFSIAEREKVEKAIQNYLSEFNIPLENLPFLIRRNTKPKTGGENPFKDPKYKGFAAKIKEDSKINRSIAQVYWYLRNAYSEFKLNSDGNTRWTSQEDQKLLHLINIKGVGKWTEIERELGREGAKDRYDCLQSSKKGKWSEEETLELIKHAKFIMERDGISDPLSFNRWTEVSALMNGTRTYRECARHWKLLGPTLKKKSSYWKMEEYRDLLQRMLLHFSHANDESEVIWKSIVKNDDLYPAEVYRTKWISLVNRMLRKHDLSSMTFKGTRMLIIEGIQFCLDNLSDAFHRKYLSAELVDSDSE